MVQVRYRVSVIVPCYNQARYLPQCVESVLQQGRSDVEIIVVNDGSTDFTNEVAVRYAPIVKCIEQANQGLSAARNTGLHNASGQFVHFLDSDDYILPGMYDSAVRTLIENPGASATY